MQYIIRTLSEETHYSEVLHQKLLTLDISSLEYVCTTTRLLQLALSPYVFLLIPPKLPNSLK